MRQKRISETPSKTPRPEQNNSLEQDDFDAWCEHPVTMHVAYGIMAQIKQLEEELIGFAISLPLSTPSAEVLARIISVRSQLIAYQSILNNGKGFYDSF